MDRRTGGQRTDQVEIPITSRQTTIDYLSMEGCKFDKRTDQGCWEGLADCRMSWENTLSQKTAKNLQIYLKIKNFIKFYKNY